MSCRTETDIPSLACCSVASVVLPSYAEAVVVVPAAVAAVAEGKKLKRSAAVDQSERWIGSPQQSYIDCHYQVYPHILIAVLHTFLLAAVIVEVAAAAVHHLEFRSLMNYHQRWMSCSCSMNSSTEASS